MGRDQLDNATRVTERGAGLRLEPDAGADAISAAVRRLLYEPGFREAAVRLGARLRAEAQGDQAVTELEGLARNDRQTVPAYARLLRPGSVTGGGAAHDLEVEQCAPAPGRDRRRGLRNRAPLAVEAQVEGKASTAEESTSRYRR